MKKKRLVVISDLHCGHEYGLTPPDWWYNPQTEHSHILKMAQFQRELWGFYTQAIDGLKPIYALVVNGDSIEGKGERSGSTELNKADRYEQIDMAAQCIQYANAQKVRILYGTRSHVGKEEDWEILLKDKIKAKEVKVEGHAFFELNGCNFDIKHKVNSSSVPHGRMTALARARLWNQIWSSEQSRQPKANVLVRSHVHYHNYCGGPNWIAMTTPALTYNSTYGTRECEGLVNVGLVYFDVNEDGSYEWGLVEADFASLKVSADIL
jgi:hypothetical protein